MCYICTNDNVGHVHSAVCTNAMAILGMCTICTNHKFEYMQCAPIMFICAVGQLAPITKFEHMQLKINHKRRSCALLCSCTSVLVHLCTCADVRLCICLIVLLCSCAGITMGRTDLPAPVSPYLEEAEYVVVLRREGTSTL